MNKKINFGRILSEKAHSYLIRTKSFRNFSPPNLTHCQILLKNRKLSSWFARFFKFFNEFERKNFPVCKLIIGKSVFFCLAPEHLKERLKKYLDKIGILGNVSLS
jgi:hypothetical protein